MMRSSAVVATLALVGLSASSARADDKQVCSDAYQQAQTLRDQHKLVKAREQLRTCAASTCPAFIVKDCTGWLKDIDPRVPSVVLTAKNAAGADVSDARVSMDGAPLVTSLDGIAVDVDPGPHTFVFEGESGRGETKVVVAEGAKAQHVPVVLGAAGAVAVVAATPAVEATPAYPSLTAASLAENGFSFGLRFGYAIPVGSLDGAASLSSEVNGHLPFWLDAGYLFIPEFYAGVYLQYGIGFPANCTGDCSASDIRIGIDAQYRFLPAAKFDPWIGVGFGYEILNGSVGVDSASASGLEFFNLQGGADYKVLPNLGIGPFLAFSLGEYMSAGLSQNGISDPNATLLGGKAIHGWIFIGVRGQYDLHI